MCGEAGPRELAIIWHFLQHRGREKPVTVLPGNGRAPVNQGSGVSQGNRFTKRHKWEIHDLLQRYDLTSSWELASGLCKAVVFTSDAEA